MQIMNINSDVNYMQGSGLNKFRIGFTKFKKKLLQQTWYAEKISKYSVCIWMEKLILKNINFQIYYV